MRRHNRDWMRAGFWFTMGASWAVLICWVLAQVWTWAWMFVVEEWQRW